MREDQIEAIERLARTYFPQGLIIGVIMPNDSLHTAIIVPNGAEEYEALLDHLGELCVEETERLKEIGDEDNYSAAGG